ncbi:uncharacterized protein LOC128951553 [Oppia nitens]|uniref:uncharacterized protein LOC128951553 n=1 Tax=Oppia nitens TaxID=1686743 RepID=UPI0023D9BC09|nr:uncharacterized protein LOC128951553 [Oppia nitens]
MTPMKPGLNSADEIIKNNQNVPGYVRNNCADFYIKIYTSTLVSAKLKFISNNLYCYTDQVIITNSNKLLLLHDDDVTSNNVQIQSSDCQINGDSSHVDDDDDGVVGCHSQQSQQHQHQVLYYYTNHESAQRYKTCGSIKLNLIRIVFNRHLKLTTLDPDRYSKSDILARYYQGQSTVPVQYRDKADWCIRIMVDKLDLTKLISMANNMFTYSDSIPINQIDVFKKPKLNWIATKLNSPATISSYSSMLNVPDRLYHYVGNDGVDTIRKVSKIQPNFLDHGINGLLLSSMSPGEFTRLEIKLDIYDNHCPIDIVDWVIPIRTVTLDRIKLHLVNRIASTNKYDLFYYDLDIVIDTNDILDKLQCLDEQVDNNNNDPANSLYP